MLNPTVVASTILSELKKNVVNSGFSQSFLGHKVWREAHSNDFRYFSPMYNHALSINETAWILSLATQLTTMEGQKEVDGV